MKFFALLMAATLAWSQSNGGMQSRAFYLDKSNSDSRVQAFQEQLKKSPDSLAAQAGLATAYLQKLRETADAAYFERASKLVDRILEVNGGELIALRLQNEIDLQLHNFVAVSERSASMTRYAPSDAGAWGNLGDASMELGEYERAGRAYTRMFALRPGLESYNRLAYFRFVTGDGESATRLMRDAADAGQAAGENTAWCLAELGDMYFKLGRLDEAAASYRASLERFPQMHRAHAGLGRVERARGQTELAIADYERAQSLVPLVDYVAALEDLYSATGDQKKAERQHGMLDAIAKLGKAANEKTNRNLALALADHNRDLPLALSLMQAEVPVRGDVYTWDAYAWVLFKAGRLAEAREASAKALSQHTPEPLFQLHARQIAAVAQ